MKLQHALMGLSALVLASSAHATNFVQNGGFEVTNATQSSEFGTNYPSITVNNWFSNSYSFVYFPGQADTGGADSQYGPRGTPGGEVALHGPGNGSANGLTGSPQGGNYVAVDPSYLVGSPYSISQTINGLTVGQKYTLGFDWAAAQQLFFNGPTTEGWDVSLGGVHQLTPTFHLANHGFSGWMHESFTFTATSSSEVLGFLATGGPSASQPPFSLLDNVSLTGGVPEPATWALMLMGFGAVGFAARRRRTVAA